MLARFDPHLIMHAAALISVAALALRDQLKLRLVLLVGILLTALYHELRTPPGYQEMFWNAVTFAINAKVIVEIVLDRTHVGLSAEENELFAAFEMLTPGEFRAIVKLAVWGTAGPEEMITREGEAPGDLFYVLRGGVDVEKAGRVFDLEPRTFIGEIAFLEQTTASATVRLAPGTRYLRWPARRLRATIEARQPLRNAVLRLISYDMAMKVVRA